ncbi:MAG TPA: sugar phosphate isomerase/epimerase [bacterium]|nr:sugar phosphate isomerase/epimerase [bacterium]HQP97726.1 sugar phosphate isomerase/epimerase [bacterium]
MSLQVTRRDFLTTTAFGILGGTAMSVPSGRTWAAQEGWQIGCYTRPWDEYEYLIALDAIAEAGFQYVGLMTAKSETRLVISPKTTSEEAAKVAEEVKKRNLKVLSVYGGGFPVNESLDAGVAALKTLIDHSATVGSKTLLTAGIESAELYDVYYKAIAECCDYAEKKGVGITLKPHGGLNATGPQCCKAVETVGHRNYSFWYDPGNIFYYSDGTLDPVKDATTLTTPVTGMCVKDYKHPKEVMLTPGTGMVDFPGVMKALSEHGFTHGPLVIETLTRGDLPAMLEEAKKAKKFLEDLVAAR